MLAVENVVGDSAERLKGSLHNFREELGYQKSGAPGAAAGGGNRVHKSGVGDLDAFSRHRNMKPKQSITIRPPQQLVRRANNEQQIKRRQLMTDKRGLGGRW